MGSYAPDSVHANVRALALEGFSGPRIARQLSLPVRTVQHWLSQWRQLAPELDAEIADSQRRINRRLSVLMERKIELTENNLDSVSLRDLSVTWGIGLSKEHERSQRQSPPGGIQVNIAIVGNAAQSVDVEPTHWNGVSRDAPISKDADVTSTTDT